MFFPSTVWRIGFYLFARDMIGAILGIPGAPWNEIMASYAAQTVFQTIR